MSVKCAFTLKLEQDNTYKYLTSARPEQVAFPFKILEAIIAYYFRENIM